VNVQLRLNKYQHAGSLHKFTKRIKKQEDFMKNILLAILTIFYFLSLPINVMATDQNQNISPYSTSTDDDKKVSEQDQNADTSKNISKAGNVENDKKSQANNPNLDSKADKDQDKDKDNDQERSYENSQEQNEQVPSTEATPEPTETTDQGISTENLQQVNNQDSTKTESKGSEEESIKVAWKDPLFKNMTSLKIFYTEFKFETADGSSFATFGVKDISKADSFISKLKEQKLSGELIFRVSLDPESTKETKINVIINAIGRNKAEYLLTSKFNYSDKADGDHNSFWQNTKEIPSGSPSCITLTFDPKTNRFKMDAEFTQSDKGSGIAPVEYVLELYMRYTIKDRELMSI